MEAEGRRAITIACDLEREEECRRAVEQTVSELGRLDVLVNHVGTQTPVDSPEELTSEQWDGTFKTNVYSYFWTTTAALRHMREGAAIINTGSVSGLRGNKSLIDYAASKGAVHVLTMSLACRRTTPARCWRRSVARRCLGEPAPSRALGGRRVVRGRRRADADGGGP